MRKTLSVSRITNYVSRITFHASRFIHHASRALLLSAICYLLSACAMPGDAALVVKIGLIAPFEGAGRPLGYAILPAVKAAIAEANTGGQLGHYRVALVALNDDLDPRAAAVQAQALALDPDVLMVVGPWSAETAAATAPILAAASLPQIVGRVVLIPAPGEKWGDPALAEASARADEDTRRLLRALADDIRSHGQPSRAGVAAALR